MNTPSQKASFINLYWDTGILLDKKKWGEFDRRKLRVIARVKTQDEERNIKIKYASLKEKYQFAFKKNGKKYWMKKKKKNIFKNSMSVRYNYFVNSLFCDFNIINFSVLFT